jgi:CheY-like chemotaxis protein
MPHKLLLADDSVTIQRVVELTFSSEDVQVLSVADGEEAIARIPVERPDIVLADIGMPRRTGYEVAAYIKERPDLAHIPVLLMAGAFEPVDEARARQVGSDGVLIKPFEPQQVIARVRELLQAAKRPEHPGPQQRQALPQDPAFDTRMDDIGIASPAAQPPKQDRAVGGEGSLDDYFDRLDAAFATLGGQKPRAAESTPRAREFDPREEAQIPSLDELMQAPSASARPIDLPVVAPSASSPTPRAAAPPVEAPDITPRRTPAPASPPSASGTAASTSAASEPALRNVVADAFTALLAVEQGEPGATPIRLATGQADPVITEAFIEEVTRRVLERLGPGAVTAVHDVVTRIVSDVSERLVEQEIRRIRGGQ